MDYPKILRVTSYGENPGESYRITFQPTDIRMVISPEALVERQGRALHKAVVEFIARQSQFTVYVDANDLKTLEEAVGNYWTDDDFIGSS
jgi:hypothetical protein